MLRCSCVKVLRCSCVNASPAELAWEVRVERRRVLMARWPKLPWKSAGGAMEGVRVPKFQVLSFVIPNSSFVIRNSRLIGRM